MRVLYKKPMLRNWRSGKVSLSHEEAATLRVGRQLVVGYEGHSEDIHVPKKIEQWMIDGLEFFDDYVLMPFVNDLKPQ